MQYNVHSEWSSTPRARPNYFKFILSNERTWTWSVDSLFSDDVTISMQGQTISGSLYPFMSRILDILSIYIISYIIWWTCNTLFWSITLSIAICIVNYFIVLQIRLALREYFLVDKEYSRVKCDTFAVMEPLKGGQNLNNFDISSIRAS